MPAETTYLELSEDSGSAHKFYEVTVDGTELTIRFGRIGERGQLRQSSFTSRDKATAEAAKKIGEKVRKGYAPAVPGGRAKRAVSRRQIISSRSTATRAPVLWRYSSHSPAFGIFVDDDGCMVGNERGLITTLGHDATVTFIDRPELAAAVRAACDLPILTMQQLNASISTADLTALGANEHRQIRHGRPNTIGELLFNFWD